MAKINYLLGRAEKLVRKIEPPKMKPSKAHARSFEEARKLLVPMVRATADSIAAVPAEACPDDEAVALVTLHPSYLAKSYFPDALLSETGLRAVGSRTRTVSPTAWALKKPPDSAPTAEIFVAGKRNDFKQLAPTLLAWSEGDRGAQDVCKIEEIRSYPTEERLRNQHGSTLEPFWEIILHATEFPESDYILEGFRAFMKSLDVKVDLDARLHAQGLCFLPVRAPRKMIDRVAEFSFLRVAREMPRMRPVIRFASGQPSFKVDLPAEDVVDPGIRVAVFDGGLPTKPSLAPWAQGRKTAGVGSAIPELQEHGLGVTSALLFGHLEEGVPLPRPYAAVDHFRVIDASIADDDSCEYFNVIKRIVSVLEGGRYEFVNISLGPDLPIEEDNVHVWTAMLDQLLKKGTILACIAAGNSGEQDHASGNARIQSPSDCVNALAVGSADTVGDDWKRSVHSSIGPGRSPGVVKPDVLSFGGSARTPFYVIGSQGSAEGRLGTSFASPAALRAAIGVRAYLGPVMSPLALKALLIHRSDASTHQRTEVGWGRVAGSLEDLTVCEDSTAHIVYQGTIPPGSWMRAPIPLPEGPIPGNVELRATICFACDTDPQDPINYTRSGLEVRFRPHDSRRKGEKQRDADTKPFFSVGKLYAHESDLRNDAHKWETTLHERRKLRGSSLQNAAFDIHYNARTGGGPARSPDDIPYALIVSVHASRMPDLYDRIFRRYRTTLEALRPIVEIPIRH